MKIISHNPTNTVGICTNPIQPAIYIGQFNAADFAELAKQVAGIFGDKIVDVEIRESSGKTFNAIFVSDGQQNPYVVMTGCKNKIWK